jgi:hypothetical protein
MARHSPLQFLIYSREPERTPVQPGAVSAAICITCRSVSGAARLQAGYKLKKWRIQSQSSGFGTRGAFSMAAALCMHENEVARTYSITIPGQDAIKPEHLRVIK